MPLLAGAEPQPGDRCQIECQLVGTGREFALGVFVPGFAKPALELQPSHQPVGDQRDLGLAKDFFRGDRSSNGKYLLGEPCDVAGLGEFVRLEFEGVVSKLDADVDRGALLGPGAADSPLVELDGRVHIADLLFERPAHERGDGKVGGGLRGHLSSREDVPRETVRICAWRGRTELAGDQR